MFAPSKTTQDPFHSAGNSHGFVRRVLGPSCVLGAALVIAGCSEDLTTAAVGLSCIPRDEYEPGFAGFGSEEITIETVNDGCAAESVCLVKGFRGRVSCPYGQTEVDLSLPIDDPRRCVLPKHAETAVTIEVQPQLVRTSGGKGVYCSALCADAQGKRDDGRNYHDCPSGFHCEVLLDSLLITSQNLAGSYCIRNDSPSKITLSASAPCELMSTDGSGTCGAARPYP